MKKVNKFCAGLLIGGVIASGGLLVGCGGGEAEVLSSNSDVYGFAAATTSMLATNDGAGAAMVGVNSLESPDHFAALKTQLKSAIDATLDEYMDMFDSISGGNKPVNTTVEDLSEGEYAHKMTITSTSANGETRTCYLYFNETLKSGGDVDDIDDEERETVLDGKLVIGDNVEFFVEGSKEIENGEVEIEFKLSATKNDTQNYVKFSQEHENGEEEYIFEIYVFGVKQAEFSLDIEKQRDGSIEIEYEKEYNGGEVGFKIEKTANNELTIKTELLDTELEIKVKAVEDAGTGQVKYQYSIVSANFEFSFDGVFRVVQ